SGSQLCGACDTMGGGLYGAYGVTGFETEVRIPVVVYLKRQFIDYSQFNTSLRRIAHQWIIVATTPAYKFLSHRLCE
ncbi:29222_t:CDS:2, partial [Gigaspora margarita]